MAGENDLSRCDRNCEELIMPFRLRSDLTWRGYSGATGLGAAELRGKSKAVGAKTRADHRTTGPRDYGTARKARQVTGHKSQVTDNKAVITSRTPTSQAF